MKARKTVGMGWDTERLRQKRTAEERLGQEQTGDNRKTGTKAHMTVDMGWDTERLQGFPCNNLYSKLKSSSKFQFICSLPVCLFYFLCIYFFSSLFLCSYLSRVLFVRLFFSLIELEN